MTTQTPDSYREWGRHQWAGVDLVPVERDVPRWNLIQWVGDTGHGRQARPIDPADMQEGDAGFSGFRHNPGAGSHWADGYGH